jgi:ABC-type branched-subunit amino acid transport system substrate-binding protein
LLARATRAIAQLAPGAEVVGSAAPEPEQPIYLNELQAARRAQPDVILLLLNSTDSIVFTGQQADVRVEAPVLELPDAVSQTRDYIAATRDLSPEHNPRVRVATWETTLPGEEQMAFNQRYGARWSEPTDPTGWAAYHAVKILVETIIAIGTKDGEAIVEYLERPDVAFDVLKGVPVSFRPWDHQLRQPVYLVNVDQQAEWSRTILANRIGIVNYSSTLPAGEPGADPAAWLDQLGDGPDETTCRF